MVLMDVVVGLGHPAHVHFYRNTIDELETRGHEVHVITKERPLAIGLLNAYNIEHEVAGRWRIQHENPLKTGLSFFSFECDVINTVRQYSPEVVTGIGNIPLAHASSIFDCTSLIFTDTEHAAFANGITFPFSDYIYTPTCFQLDVGENQIKYPSYHELAYLHPARFTPDPGVLDDVGISSDERFVILRTVAWNAIHDAGDSGFDSIIEVVNEIEDQGVRVLITAEDDLPKSLKKYQISIEPHRIHNLQYYADLFLGESATMAAESAVLGTPSIFVSTVSLGYMEELEHEYGLVSNFSGERRQINAMNTAISILKNYDQELWDERRQTMLDDKIDTTDFIVDRITRTLD